MTTRLEPGSTGDRIPLRELIKWHGPLSPESALLVFRDSLLGLSAAHDHGIPHRDYRPENVLVGRDGSSELINFNVTGRAGAGLASYQAPEQRDGAPPSQASNLYAATAVLFECLTGTAPSPERIRRFRRQQLAVSVLTGEAAEPLRGLMAWGMAADPASRPASATELIVELDDMASAVYGPDWHQRARHDLAERVTGSLTPGPGTAGNAGGRPPASRFRSHGRVLYAGIAAVAAVAILGAAGTAVALSGHFGSKPSPPASMASPGSPPGSASTSAVSGSSTRADSAPSGGKATFTARADATPSATSSACVAPVSCGQPTPTTTAPPTTAAPPTLISQPNIDVQLITNQLQPKTVLCGSTPLTFEVFASITPSETYGRETYHWVRPDGTTTAPSTLNLTAGNNGSTSTLFTPASDNFSGAETLVFTSPVKGSWSLPLSLTCSTSTAPPAALTMRFPPAGPASEITVTLNAPFSATFTAVGGTAPYTWTAAELPPGLTINASTGTVSGTATSLSPGNYSLITVRDAGNPAQQVTLHYTFNIRLP